MEKEFVCIVDGEKFSSEEEALSYMIQEFLEEKVMEEKTSNNGLSNMQIRLEKEFPTFQFHLTKRPYTPDDVRCADEDDPWFKGKEIITVKITSTKFEMPSFYFFIKPLHENDYNDEQNDFETLEEAIIFYKRFLFGAEKFSASILGEIQKYDSEIHNCVITKICQTYGTADSFNEYHYELRNSHDEVKSRGHVELSTRDLDSDKQLNNEINRIVKGIKGSYVPSVEGELQIRTPKYGNDHHYWYEIDGVSIEELASRAKILRIEILELKNEEEL